MTDELRITGWLPEDKPECYAMVKITDKRGDVVEAMCNHGMVFMGSKLEQECPAPMHPRESVLERREEHDNQ
jgi:hypothetical protein